MKDNVEIAQDYTDWMFKTGGYAKDMTLRDHFAGLVLAQIIGDHVDTEDSLTCAEVAYCYADAMLQERNE
jgi:hypothetical protein